MKTSYKIAVMAASCQPEQFHKTLSKLGLEKECAGKYSGIVSEQRKIRKIRNFASSHHLKFLYDNPYGQRSTDYRKAFFAAHPSENNKYRCVYCGRQFAKKDIQIDHLYPVAKVSRSLRLQNKLAEKGIDSVNSLANLVPSCGRCNQKKSDCMGMWILKGKLGRSDGLWKVRWVLRFVFLVLLILFLIWVIWSLVQYQRFPF